MGNCLPVSPTDLRFFILQSEYLSGGQVKIVKHVVRGRLYKGETLILWGAYPYGGYRLKKGMFLRQYRWEILHE